MAAGNKVACCIAGRYKDAGREAAMLRAAEGGAGLPYAVSCGGDGQSVFQYCTLKPGGGGGGGKVAMRYFSTALSRSGWVPYVISVPRFKPRCVWGGRGIR
eukprot:704557-Rhodomonas_salina.1